MEKLILKLNHIIFWWYYKRVSEFFKDWTVLKSVRLLKDNYEHALFREEGLNKVISGAIKREEEMRREISNLKLRAMGVSQDKLNTINEMFGVDLRGISNQERDN